MSISEKLKNALNKLPPHLGNVHFGTILKDMSDKVDGMSEYVDGMSEYSETPKRIGAWIDGTPIWRMAINYNLSDMAIADAAYNYFDDIGISDKIIIVLGGRAMLTGTVPAAVDFVDCTLYPSGTFEWDKTTQQGSGYTHLVGYIDFACDEEYIPGDDA